MRLNTPAEKLDARVMRRLFGIVAPRYDTITRVLSFGMDAGWKRAALAGLDLPRSPTVLDLACGTGDFTKLVRQQNPVARAIGCDLTETMLREALRTGVRSAVCASAMQLPFGDDSFDAVCVGYGFRNFPDLDRSIREIARVTRPGGGLVSLDFFLPENRLWQRLYVGFLYAQGAFWGWIFHREAHIYTYIPDSLRGFVTLRQFSERLNRNGFAGARERSYLGGGIGIHWARKG